MTNRSVTENNSQRKFCQDSRKPVRHAILAAGIVLVFLLLASFTSVSGSGRYQLDAWAFSQGDGTGQYGAFVLDTATGETRLVYRAEYSRGKESVIKNSLGRAFHSYDAHAPEAGESIRELKQRAGER